MKSVLVLTGFGLAVLAMLACRSSTPAPAPAPVSRPEPPPIVEIVDKIEPDPPERVLSSQELLLLKDDLKLTKVPEEGVEYVRMSRAGPQRFLKLKQPSLPPAPGGASEGKPAPVASKPFEEFLGTGKSSEFRIYSRAGPRPLKREPPIAKQD